MIHASTHLRLSVAGGGSDLPEYYNHSGAELLAAGLNYRMEVYVAPRSDERCSVRETGSDIVAEEDVARAPGLVGCILRRLRPEGADIYIKSPIAGGSGLGSSGALTAAMVAALLHLRGEALDRSEIIRLSFEIEREDFGAPVGFQDAVTAIYGGLVRIRIAPEGMLTVVDEPELFHNLQAIVRENGIMFDTGIRRRAQVPLKALSEGLRSKSDKVVNGSQAIAGLLRRIEDSLRDGSPIRFGEALHEHWNIKRQISSAMSDGRIDEAYADAIRMGAYGGKVVGAGGGGYLFIICPEEQKNAVRARLGIHDMSELPFSVERGGLFIRSSAEWEAKES